MSDRLDNFAEWAKEVDKRDKKMDEDLLDLVRRLEVIVDMINKKNSADK